MEILDIPKSASNLKRLGVSAVRSPRIGLISNQKCFKNHIPSHHTLIQIAIHISKNICIANYVNEVHQNGKISKIITKYFSEPITSSGRIDGKIF